MTSLTAVAGSFFSRSVGCVTGQPGPQDVACGVLVCVGMVPAAATSEYRLGEAVLYGCVPAVFAAVGGVPGVDLDHGASSVFRFGAQNRDELPPARIGDTSVQPGLRGCTVGQELAGVVGVGDGCGPAHHGGDRQVLDGDQVIGLHERAGGFVVEVAAAVGDLAMPCSQRLTSAAPVLGPRFGAGQPLLRCGQPGGGGAGPARVMMCSPSEVVAKLAIPTSTPAWRPVAGIGLAGTSSQDKISIQRRPSRRIWIVFTRPTTSRCALTLTWPTPCRYTRRGVGVPAGAVTVLGPLHTVEPRLAFEPRITRPRPGFHPPKETLKGPVEPAQRGLLAGERPHRHIRAHRPDLAQLRRLIAVADASPACPPGVAAFLQRCVVQLPMPIHTRRQRDVLTRSRAQPELICPPHPSTERRKRNSTMAKGYKRPPTLTLTAWLGAPIPPTAKAASPLRAI